MSVLRFTTLPPAASQTPETSTDPESGRIGLLLLVGVVIVVSIVLVGAAITSIHLQRSRLFSCADGLAAAGAHVISAESFFSGYEAGEVSAAEARQARERVEGFLDESRGTTCNVGQGVRVEEATRVNGEFVVTVSAQADLVAVPRFIGAVVAPQLRATASARLR